MLEFKDLRITIGERELVVIDQLTVRDGERVGIVGESGSGKTLTVLSVIGLLPASMQVQGSIRFDGRELLGLSEKQLISIRGKDISMVFQDPGRALNPTMKIGRQIAEALKLHMDLSRPERRARVIELMESVQLPRPDQLTHRYPHELSGGQQQRVMIAIAVACEPKLLIADEPTTALDVTVQQGVLKLLMRLSEEKGMSMMLVSHNLGVVQSTCERIVVMNSGRVVETGVPSQIIDHSRAAYTKSLIDANPRIPGSEQLPRVAVQREQMSEMD